MIFTAANEEYCHGLKWFLKSVRQWVDWPICVVDLGMGLKTRQLCRETPDVIVVPLEDPEPGLFTFCEPWVRTAWRSVMPFMRLAPRHDRALWLDCDTILCDHPDKLWRKTFTVYQEHFAPLGCQNKPTLYQRLPIAGPTVAGKVLNSGVIAVARGIDENVLTTWRETTIRMGKNAELARASSWCCQGSLLWTLQYLNRLDCIHDNIQHNRPANDLVDARVKRKQYQNTPDFLAEVKRDHPGAVVVHWMGEDKYWSNWGP